MPPKKSTFPCKVCKKTTVSSHSLRCTVCLFWVHQNCGDVSDELKATIEKFPSCKWVFPHCEEGVEKLNDRISAINQKTVEMDMEIKANKKGITDLSVDVGNVKSNCDKNTEKLKDAKSDAQDAVFIELRAREDKKGNLILHNVPESDCNTGKERQDEDFVNTLIFSKVLR